MYLYIIVYTGVEVNGYRVSFLSNIYDACISTSGCELIPQCTK